MKESKTVFLEPEVDDLCYLLGQAIARLLEEGQGIQPKDRANPAEPTDDQPAFEKQDSEV